MRTRSYRLELQLDASPEQLWSLVSDTNRFNRDAGVPSVESLGVGDNARRRLRLTRFGVGVEWEEQPFEWVSPHRFSVERRYVRGPVAWMRTAATLEPHDGGTTLVYNIDVLPRGVLGPAAVAFQVGFLSRRRFASVFRAYDRSLRTQVLALPAPKPHLAPGAGERIATARQGLLAAGLPADDVDRLCTLVTTGDEFGVATLRPYALADAWGRDRREVLELCLLATRHGLLELRWELICPLCRNAAASEANLDGLGGQMHCQTCRIDLTADVSRSVEVVFRPAPAIRAVSDADFCVAGPQVTPHVVAQQLLADGERRVVELELGPGRYRLRALALDGGAAVEVAADGSDEATVEIGSDGWSSRDVRIGFRAAVTLDNSTAAEQLVVLERTAWADTSTTAADVTVLQAYRDLFAAEALRVGEPISVGTLTVVFTDLRGSTQYYREVGDAPAFGSVLGHIDLLREAVARGGGSVVKAMGDAIMAVFPRPIAAVEAMRRAQESAAGKPLALKVGIHTGPCIAVSQNGVLDYFGSTVNLAARLVSLSGGDDLVVSDAVLSDPEVAALGVAADEIDPGVLKGFEGEALSIWRLRA
jgi:class 3 adenylate cyclase